MRSFRALMPASAMKPIIDVARLQAPIADYDSLGVALADGHPKTDLHTQLLERAASGVA